MNDDEMEEAYGSVRDSNSQSGCNAYMLMYRQYDPRKNIVEFDKEEVLLFLIILRMSFIF
jgi:hypothetical protein